MTGKQSQIWFYESEPDMSNPYYRTDAIGGVYEADYGYPKVRLRDLRDAFIAVGKDEPIHLVASEYIRKSCNALLDRYQRFGLSFEYHVWNDPKAGPCVVMYRHGEAIWNGELFPRKTVVCPTCNGEGVIWSEVEYKMH